MRQVPADRVVSAIPPRRGNPKPPKEARTPRVVELLRKAIEWQALPAGDVGLVGGVAGLQEGVTWARVTQIMGMLRLAPEIQLHILSMPEMVRCPAITERALRPIAQLEPPEAQAAAFRNLLSRDPA